MNQNKLSITDLEVNMLELVFKIKTQDQDNPYLDSLDSETSAIYGELQTEYCIQL